MKFGKLLGLKKTGIYKKYISKNSEISAVLKSNAYGLGLENIAKKLIKIGCKSFFFNTIK